MPVVWDGEGMGPPCTGNSLSPWNYLLTDGTEMFFLLTPETNIDNLWRTDAPLKKVEMLMLGCSYVCRRFR